MRAVYTWSAILAIVFASVVGDVLLARAMKQVGDVGALRRRSGLGVVIGRTLSNPHFLLGVTAMAVAFFVASLLTPRIMERFGGRRTVAVGAAVNVIGLIGLILTVAGSWPRVSLLSLAPSLVVTGFGQALVFVSLFRLVLANVPPHHAGVSGGALVTIQQSGLAIGVATLGTLYLSLDTHSISEAFTATTAAEAAILAVLGISSRFIHATGTTKGGNDE